MGVCVTDQSSIETMMRLQKERGEQLRALIVSWDEEITFVEALRKQTEEIAAGGPIPSDDWGIIANQVYAGYKSQPKMEWPEDQEPEPESKIIVP